MPTAGVTWAGRWPPSSTLGTVRDPPRSGASLGREESSPRFTTCMAAAGPPQFPSVPLNPLSRSQQLRARRFPRPPRAPRPAEAAAAILPPGTAPRLVPSRTAPLPALPAAAGQH